MRMRSLVALSILLALGCAPEPTECVTPEPEPAVAPVVAAPEVESLRSAAEPVEVCRHVREVASKYRTDPDELVAVERDCVIALEHAQGSYESLVSCLSNAIVDTEIAECEAAMRNLADQISAFSPMPTELEICTHVMGIMRREFGPDHAPTEKEVAKYTQTCVTEMTAEAQRLGDAKYRAQATCVMAAKRMEELMECDEDERKSE